MDRWLFVVLTLFIFSCAEEEGVFEQDNTDMFVYDGAIIDPSYPYVGEGNHLVFHRYLNEESDPEIADSGYAEDLLFEVISDQDHFFFTGKELTEIPILLNQYCFCLPVDFIEITDGFIEGNKQGSNWLLDVDIQYNLGFINSESGDTVIVDDARKLFTGLFKSKERP